MSGKTYIGNSSDISKQVKKIYFGKRNPLYVDLPNEYQQVEYIESTGTQYIDTEIIPYTNTVAQFKVMNLAVTGACIIGYFIDDTTDWRFFNANSNIYFDRIDSRINTTKADFVINVIREFELGNYYVKDLSNNSIILSGTKTDFIGLSTIKLNASSNTETTMSNNRWYYVKLYDGENLVRDLIPCYRKSDNKTGLYDLVTNTFLPNLGTSEFLLGNAIYSGIAKKIKYAYVGDPNGIARRIFPESFLPSGYQQVEYIESTGTQMITTDYNVQSTDRMLCDYSFPVKVNSTNQDVYVFGAGSRNASSSNNSFAIAVNYGITSAGRYYLCLGGGSHREDFDRNRHIAIINSQSITVMLDENNKTATAGSFSRCTANQLLRMFGGYGGTTLRKTTARLYHLYIQENGTSGEIIHDYYPCRRLSDNAGGLYDIVSRIFWNNNDGTGDFILGPDYEAKL